MNNREDLELPVTRQAKLHFTPAEVTCGARLLELVWLEVAPEQLVSTEILAKARFGGRSLRLMRSLHSMQG